MGGISGVSGGHWWWHRESGTKINIDTGPQQILSFSPESGPIHRYLAAVNTEEDPGLRPAFTECTGTTNGETRLPEILSESPLAELNQPKNLTIR